MASRESFREPTATSTATHQSEPRFPQGLFGPNVGYLQPDVARELARLAQVPDDDHDEFIELVNFVRDRVRVVWHGKRTYCFVDDHAGSPTSRRDNLQELARRARALAEPLVDLDAYTFRELSTALVSSFQRDPLPPNFPRLGGRPGDEVSFLFSLMCGHLKRLIEVAEGAAANQPVHPGGAKRVTARYGALLVQQLRHAFAVYARTDAGDATFDAFARRFLDDLGIEPGPELLAQVRNEQPLAHLRPIRFEEMLERIQQLGKERDKIVSAIEWHHDVLGNLRDTYRDFEPAPPPAALVKPGGRARKA